MHIYIDVGNVVITSFGTAIPKFAFQVRDKLGFVGDSKQKIEIECQNESIAGDFGRPVIKKNWWQGSREAGLRAGMVFYPVDTVLCFQTAGGLREPQHQRADKSHRLV